MATTETLTTGRVVGTPVPRKEDRKLVTGHGQFIDNINLPGQLWLSVVRSPYAHATIKRVELTAARELEGVVAAFSAPAPPLVEPGLAQSGVQRLRARCRLGGLAAVRLAGHGRDQDALALPARVRQGTARR